MDFQRKTLCMTIAASHTRTTSGRATQGKGCLDLVLLVKAANGFCGCASGARGLLLSVPFLLFAHTCFGPVGCSYRYAVRPEDPLKALSCEDPTLIALGAVAICECNDSQLRAAAIEPLCRLLQHHDPLVRSAACRALRSITGTDCSYAPYADPEEHRQEIQRWRALAERALRREP